MKPTEITKGHVIATYVNPARLRGDRTVDVRVGTVQKELGWTNRTPSVYSTLSSKEFQQEAGVELIEKKGGPRSGGPSTTVEFVYRVLDPTVKPGQGYAPPAQGSKLMALYGLCSSTFHELGGGEEFLGRERDWGADTWEKYGQERREGHEDESAK